MDKTLVAALAARAGFNIKASAIDGQPWIDARELIGGGHVLAGVGYQPPSVIDHIAQLVTLVAEECAKMADKRGTGAVNAPFKDYENTHIDGYQDCAVDTATDIRKAFVSYAKRSDRVDLPT